MPTKNPTDPILDAARLACADETKAVEFFEACRWNGKAACPRCGDMDVYQMREESGARNADYRWRCRGCKKMFTVRTDMVFEESRLPMTVWAFAFWKACSSKKGVSALQVSRECEISYKSALRVMHGVRESMGENGAPALGGPGKTLEADETYCGGKPRYKGAQYGNKHGRGTKKVPVVGIAERGGGIRLRVVDRVTSATLASALREHADPRSRLVTDDLRDYCKPGATFAEHATVNHTRKEYARGDIHSNSIEGAFSLLKRGLYGTFHSVSRAYLPRYLNEFEFRHNYRFTNDGERTVRAIKAAEGKVSPYCERTA